MDLAPSSLPPAHASEPWHSVFLMADDAQWVVAPDGAVVGANLQAGLLFPLPPGGSIRPLLDSLRPARVRDRLHAALDSIEFDPVRASGVLLGSEPNSAILDLHFRAISDGFRLLSFRDASQRQRIECHAQRLITAIDATSDVVYLADPAFRLTFANAAFQTATGFTIEDALGRHLSFMRAPSEADRCHECEQAVQSGRGWRGEWVNLRSNGERYPVEAAVSPIYDPEGRFLGSVTFERDLTAAKELQDALRLERNFVHSILDSLQSALYAVDLEFRLTHFNGAWQQFPAHHAWLHFPESPRLGTSLLDAVPDPQKREQLSSLFAEVLSDGCPREFRVSESEHHWLVSVAAWRHEETVHGLIYKVTDQTSSVTMQNQLYQAQKMETVGVLAAGVAHDFNNLLLAIRGNVGLLMLDSENQPRIKERLVQVEAAAAQASDITHQLLSFSRHSDEQCSIVDLNSILHEAAHLATRTLRSKVSVRTEVHSSPCFIRIDPTRAQQLLLNLCVNASDAMPSGGLITLRTDRVRLSPLRAARHSAAPGECYVCCSVTDTGAGIPNEVLPRIFDPFFTTKGKGKGTGLGLAIVHSAVVKAGGFIEVESVAGRGTSFNVFFPEAENAPAAPKAARASALKTGSGCVLVVDDLDLVLDFTRAFLTAAGYFVLTASSVDGALETLGNPPRPIDLLFTDYNMPEKSGWQLIQEVQAQWPHIKIILASGYMDEKERTQAEVHDGVRILDKPYNISDATQLVAALLHPETRA